MAHIWLAIALIVQCSTRARPSQHPSPAALAEAHTADPAPAFQARDARFAQRGADAFDFCPRESLCTRRARPCCLQLAGWLHEPAAARGGGRAAAKSLQSDDTSLKPRPAAPRRACCIIICVGHARAAGGGSRGGLTRHVQYARWAPCMHLLAPGRPGGPRPMPMRAAAGAGHKHVGSTSGAHGIISASDSHITPESCNMVGTGENGTSTRQHGGRRHSVRSQPRGGASKPGAAAS